MQAVKNVCLFITVPPMVGNQKYRAIIMKILSKKFEEFNCFSGTQMVFEVFTIKKFPVRFS